MSEVGGWERFSRCLTACGVASCALLVVHCLLVRLVGDVAGIVATFPFFFRTAILRVFRDSHCPFLCSGLTYFVSLSFLVSQGEVRASRV